MYKVPDEYFFRIHHSRPRFKNDVESVMLFMAGEISRMPKEDKDLFRADLNAAIKLYPGNSSATDKTIDNWRTEISSLFGLIEREDNLRAPSQMAFLLAENQDLIEFFRYFLFYFQYPGGHLKSQESLKMINVGIKFKPAKYLIETLMEGLKQNEDGKFGLTKAEATHCIFNDMRITRDNQPPRITAANILALRIVGTEYDNDGDSVRYAGDILDYMELADLVRQRPNHKYYLNMANVEVLQAFISSDSFFKPYDALYNKKNVVASEITETLDDWFDYVNNKLDSSIFQADVLSIIQEASTSIDEPAQSEFITEVLEKIRKRRASALSISTQDIGNVGETIVIEHEKVRLTQAQRTDLLHLIKKLPEQYAVGYDIGSYDGVGTKRRYIEVKTTVSRGRLYTSNFHMSPSEWSAAESNGEIYYIYRLLISSEKVSLFLIHNPVAKYKQDLLQMVPRNGVDVRYTEKSGRWEELLV